MKSKINVKLWLVVLVIFIQLQVKAQLLYDRNYDDGNVGKRECHVLCNDPFTKTSVLTDSPGGKTGKSIRHSIWHCDERSEIAVYNDTLKTKIGDEQWYGWKYYWPADFDFTSGGIIAQFPAYPLKPGRNLRAGGCSGAGTDLRLSGHDVELTFQRPAEGKDVLCTHHAIAADLTKGVWHSIVVHAKWTENMDGFIEIYWDGVKTVSLINQPTYWNDEGKGPYFKHGAYKGDPGWKGTEPFTLYTDDLRIGDQNSGYSQVCPDCPAPTDK